MGSAMSQGNGLVERLREIAAHYSASERQQTLYEAATRIEADAKRIADVEAERDALKARVDELETERTANARRIVDELFADLRDRRLLKWLFSEEPTYIGMTDLSSLDVDVQDEIRQSWMGIVRASEGDADPAASPLSEGDGRT